MIVEGKRETVLQIVIYGVDKMSVREIDPKETTRASAFELWMKAPNPMVTFYLPVSFQFHHSQMDGAHAGRFLENLQKEMNELRNLL